MTHPRISRAFCALLLAACTMPVLAGPDGQFDDALASYRAARYSEAFGRMMALANRGDADAARIVLFMHQYGPMLYGSYWDLNPQEVDSFREVAMLASNRRAPVFVPYGQARKPAAVKAVRASPGSVK
ncbi:hypothetical protein [Ramlibacter albus]|uniref:Uncharacterized protein n=1 Tax=Ramlibacter albus TaxID=2079448 RepID=A0A923ME30_9BURK|nr:hypothetical protein [Ramlibacter albus]MBC5767876.1 hypothetical protein [Ramlibacter albus]